MTYENCKKYMEEAKDKETKTFWEERIARKYPDKVVKVVEKPKKKKKEVKEDDNN